jgi:predicted DsbA family dithiol-disulfide isomerase
MKQRLMDLYFTEGGDLTKNDVLAQAAADIGLPGDEFLRLLATEQDVDAVAQQAQAAKDAGIDGVPCFIFGGVFAVSGAQAPDYLAGAIERAAEQIAKPAAE